ncbi:DNA polymerase III, beta subunit (plasmid) [Rhodoferax ferrireducens T118]|uniref:Beta sliding clamp n=1 Tax=Albidiferax ferrireducens (strain ATCC BAA-621 / DSM 15236 / T118) TaxID=338969 RepID=Q21QE8_ALBFT|nr:DNA polymerase III subunit beta [Rhodoferax ferrireducens]ABD71997.1 DNA polymerase III, beta subunit [Rhodoferax ferrireducens T118]
MQFKLTSTQAQLYGLLQAVNGIVPRSSSLVILGNVLLNTCSDGRITAVGTDLEVEVNATQHVGSFTGALSTTVESRKLMDILQTMANDEPVTLASENPDHLVLTGANGTFKLSCLPADDFPRMEIAPNYQETFRIKQGVLKGLIEKTGFAMALHDIRYYLIGMQFVVEGGRLTVCTSDGFRVATDEVAVESSIPTRREVILPRKSVLELKRLTRDTDDQVEVQLSANQARIRFGALEFVTKLVEGKFPDIRAVVPQHNDNVVTLSRSALLLAIQRAAVIMSQKVNGVRFILDHDLISGHLKVESSNEKNETVDLSMPVEYSGPMVDIGFNVKYLLDALPTMEGDDLVLAFSHTLVPGAALMTLPSDDHFKYILMPMRI